MLLGNSVNSRITHEMKGRAERHLWMHTVELFGGVAILHQNTKAGINLAAAIKVTINNSIDNSV